MMTLNRYPKQWPQLIAVAGGFTMLHFALGAAHRGCSPVDFVACALVLTFFPGEEKDRKFALVWLCALALLPQAFWLGLFQQLALAGCALARSAGIAVQGREYSVGAVELVFPSARAGLLLGAQSFWGLEIAVLLSVICGSLFSGIKRRTRLGLPLVAGFAVCVATVLWVLFVAVSVVGFPYYFQRCKEFHSAIRWFREGSQIASWALVGLVCAFAQLGSSRRRVAT